MLVIRCLCCEFVLILIRVFVLNVPINHVSIQCATLSITNGTHTSIFTSNFLRLPFLIYRSDLHYQSLLSSVFFLQTHYIYHHTCISFCSLALHYIHTFSHSYSPYHAFISSSSTHTKHTHTYIHTALPTIDR